jgi:alpha-beta hydrolase superfamily lysophospholipase
MSGATPAPSLRVHFNAAPGHGLVGRLDAPAGGPRGWAVLAHCFTCGKDLKSLGVIARALAAHGITALRFDFTGVGESGGEFAATTLTSHLDDLLAAAAFVEGRVGGPGLLFGHSLGGVVALLAAHRLPAVRAVATLACPSDTGHFRATLLRRIPELSTSGEGEIALGGGRYRVRRALLDDLAAHRLDDVVAGLARPLLVLHSPADATVDIAEGERLFAFANQPKSFVAIDGADHLLLAEGRAAAFVGELLATWAGRYLQ